MREGGATSTTSDGVYLVVPRYDHSALRWPHGSGRRLTRMARCPNTHPNSGPAGFGSPVRFAGTGDSGVWVPPCRLTAGPTSTPTASRPSEWMCTIAAGILRAYARAIWRRSRRKSTGRSMRGGGRRIVLTDILTPPRTLGSMAAAAEAAARAAVNSAASTTSDARRASVPVSLADMVATMTRAHEDLHAAMTSSPPPGLAAALRRKFDPPPPPDLPHVTRLFEGEMRIEYYGTEADYFVAGESITDLLDSADGHRVRISIERLD